LNGVRFQAVPDLRTAARAKIDPKKTFCAQLTPAVARGAIHPYIIENGLPDAKVEQRFEPEGLVCRIELPGYRVRRGKILA